MERMTMRTRSAPRLPVKEKDRDVHVGVIGAHELMRTPDKRQVFLANATHWGILSRSPGLRSSLAL
jgi:hypothetical protein